MKYLFILIMTSLMLSACSSDETAVELCDCNPDEYCVDHECFPTNATIAPAPDETK